MTAITEVSTFANIPTFVPFGVLYYTQDTGDLYIGTGNSTGPAVNAVNGGGGGTGTVTSVAFVGDGTVLSSTPSAAITTSGNVSASLNTAAGNTVLGNATASTAAPSYGQVVNGQIANSTIDLTAKVTNALPIANGGTGSSTAGANTVFGNATGSAAAPNYTSNPVITSLLCTDTAANADIIERNTTTATSGSTLASPTQQFQANYWTGAASATDSWTIGSSIGAGTNGPSTLSITHSGSTGATQIQAPNGSSSAPMYSFAGKTTGGMYFNGTNVIIQSANANGQITLGSGNLVLNDGNATITQSNINLVLSNQHLNLANNRSVNWNSTTTGSNSSNDTCVSRISAGALGAGNGTNGDTSGVMLANGGHGVTLTATTTIASVAPVKADTSNANQIVVATTTDTGPGIVIGVCINSPNAGAKGQVITSGIAPLVLGTGTAAIGNFVVVDTTTNGRVKCTTSYPTPGALVGIAMAAQSTVGNNFNVMVGLR